MTAVEWLGWVGLVVGGLAILALAAAVLLLFVVAREDREERRREEARERGRAQEREAAARLTEGRGRVDELSLRRARRAAQEGDVMRG